MLTKLVAAHLASTARKDPARFKAALDKYGSKLDDSQRAYASAALVAGTPPAERAALLDRLLAEKEVKTPPRIGIPQPPPGRFDSSATRYLIALPLFDRLVAVEETSGPIPFREMMMSLTDGVRDPRIEPTSRTAGWRARTLAAPDCVGLRRFIVAVLDDTGMYRGDRPRDDEP
jgi:hypothetical protein